MADKKISEDYDDNPVVNPDGTEIIPCIDGTNLNAAMLLSVLASAVRKLRSVVSVLTSSSGVVNIDYSLGDYFTHTLDENVTSITFSNLPGSGHGASLMIWITQDSTPRTVAWPASFRWEGGTDGVVSTGSGVIDLLAISTKDNGTTWDATLSKNRAA